MADIRPVNRISTISLLIGAALICLPGAGARSAYAAPQTPTPEQQRNAAAQKDLAAWEDQELAEMRRRAEQGDAQGQFELGFMYFAGSKVPRSCPAAGSWLQKAARQHPVLADLTLGSMYDNGLGVPKDDVQAVYWYRKAA